MCMLCEIAYERLLAWRTEVKLKGVAGIVTGLIPSIALSAASWYIKKRLEKEVSGTHYQTISQM
ncbi:hypothetical protein GBAR_LOCUS26762, partial [Geodia barretti]